MKMGREIICPPQTFNVRMVHLPTNTLPETNCKLAPENACLEYFLRSGNGAILA